MRQKERKEKGILFVVSGPSGSGKTTLVEKLIKGAYLGNKLVRSVSVTTRPRRSAEENGRDYLFLSREEFLRRQKAKKFLEWTKYLGYYYATPRDFLNQQLKENRHVILCLDLKGARKIRRFYPGNTVSIFILPPSLSVLHGRIERRCNRTKKKEIRQRLKLARNELSLSGKYDYRLVNKNLKQAVRELRGIILKETNR